MGLQWLTARATARRRASCLASLAVDHPSPVDCACLVSHKVVLGACGVTRTPFMLFVRVYPLSFARSLPLPMLELR